MPDSSWPVAGWKVNSRQEAAMMRHMTPRPHLPKEIFMGHLWKALRFRGHAIFTQRLAITACKTKVVHWECEISNLYKFVHWECEISNCRELGCNWCMAIYGLPNVAFDDQIPPLGQGANTWSISRSRFRAPARPVAPPANAGHPLVGHYQYQLWQHYIYIWTPQ